MEPEQSITQSAEELDRQLARLFCRRMELAALEAREQGKAQPVFVSGAPNPELLAEAVKEDPALEKYYRAFWQTGRQLAAQYQMEVLGRSLVAYQGVEGAFSHIALRRLFPQAGAKSYSTWAAVFDAVQGGEAAYGVLPFENSNAGDVSAVLDLCFAYPELHVCKVCDLPVRQNLLALPGARLADIRRVVSHPQAIAQSARFLNSLGLASSECLNTAVAAKQVAESGDLTLAAIASAETAELYGLQVLAAGINSDGDNTTRFIVITREKPTGGDRFSLLFTVDHKAGQLARVIQAIGAAGFNMECIKSRPMPGVPFEYYFYVELEGQPGEQASKTLLEALGQICNTLRVLGVYTK